MTGLEWMYGRDLPLLSLTFARDVPARGLLERMGADPASLAVRDQDDFLDDFGDVLHDGHAYVVSAGRYGRWAWAWEHASRRCVEDEHLVCRISVGTAALVLHAAGPRVEFGYAEDGRRVTGVKHVAGAGSGAPHRPRPVPFRRRTPGAGSRLRRRRSRPAGDTRPLLPPRRTPRHRPSPRGPRHQPGAQRPTPSRLTGRSASRAAWASTRSTRTDDLAGQERHA